MRERFQIAALAAVLTLSIGLVIPAMAPVSTLTQPEVDNLAASTVLGRALRQEGSLGERMKRGFAGVRSNPRVEAGQRFGITRFVEAPLPRWVGGIPIATAGHGGDSAEWTELDRSRFGAAFAFALALVFIMSAGRRVFDGRATYALLATLVVLVMPGTWDAATSAGYAATLMLASAALVAATLALARGASGVWAGIAWGMCLASHPAALFLIVPVIAAAAIGHPNPDRDVGADARGHLRLPSVRLSVLAVPVLGALTLVLMWPSLWTSTTKGLVAWFTEPYKVVEPNTWIAGYSFAQATTKPPSGWVGLLQFVGWVPLPLLAAWGVGVVATIRRGADGAWAPLLLTLTLLITAAAAGGLFTGHMSLLPLIWPPVAITTLIGLHVSAAWVAERIPRLWRLPSRPAILGLALTISLSLVAAGAYPLGAPNGSEALQPIPMALLDRIAAEQPDASISIVGGERSWARLLRTVSRYDSRMLKPVDDPAQAQWIIVVNGNAAPAKYSDKARSILQGVAPQHRMFAGGLGFEAYKRITEESR